MSVTAQEQQRIFLAYRTIFEGQTAQLRRQKKIEEVVDAHQKHPSRGLLQTLGKKKVVGVLKTLLERRVFESELKAKLAFPALFQTTVAQDAQHNASEIDAARSEAEALEEVASVNADNEEHVEEALEHEPGELPETPESVQFGGIEIPSLYPSYIPYRVQHLVLNEVQYLLEECAFEFASKWLPSLLQKSQWDCPEAIELNKWTYAMIKRWDSLPEDAFAKNLNLPLTTILLSVNKLRHSAVHRLRTSAKGVMEMIQSAVNFARLLRDTFRESQLDELYREFEAKIKALELNKNFLENILDQELREIAEQRAQLDQREKDAISTMVREDEEYKILIGSRLEQCIHSVFNKDTQPSTEPDTKAETDSEDEVSIQDERPLAPEPPEEKATVGDELTERAAPAIVLEALPEEPVEEDTRDIDWSSTPEPESVSERHIAEDDQALPPAPPPAPTPPPLGGISPIEEGTCTPEVFEGWPISESHPIHDLPLSPGQTIIPVSPAEPAIEQAVKEGQTGPSDPLEPPRQDTAPPLELPPTAIQAIQNYPFNPASVQLKKKQVKEIIKNVQGQTSVDLSTHKEAAKNLILSRFYTFKAEQLRARLPQSPRSPQGLQGP